MIAKRMKMIAAGIFVIAQAAGVAFGVPNDSTVTDVRYTVHNLSNNNDPAKGLTQGEGRNYNASSTGQADQVCIFCHTPHNASPAVPLWNKVYPAGAAYADGFRLYTSSATLSSAAKTARLTENSVSLLCLSCHDGKTAINVLHNSSYREDGITGAGDVIINIDSMTGTSGEFSIGMITVGSTSVNPANLGALRNSEGYITDALYGNNLTDDHPIGFSYSAAVDENKGQLKPTPDAGIRLFGGRVECSSCHNPHVYYGSSMAGSSRIDYSTFLPVSQPQRERTPFLTMSNSGSKLCLGCHIK